MKTKKFLALLQILVVLSMLLAACAPAATPTPAPAAEEPEATEAPAAEEPAAEEKPLSFGYTLHVPVPFTEEIKFGALQAGQDLGVNVEVVAPDKYDPQQQIALFEGFISKGVDGLVTVPQGDVWKKVIDDTTAKGLPVMTANVTSPGSQAQTFVGEDAYLNGSMLGEATAKVLNDAGVSEGLAVVGSCAPGVQVLTDRYNGFKDVMAKDAPGVTVSESFDVTSEPGTNYTAWENLLSSNPDMTVAVGLCSIDIPNLAKLKDKSGVEFYVVGFDLVTETMDAIKAGKADVTIGQHPYLQGYLPILAMVQELRDGKKVEGWIPTPTEVVTKDNVEELYKRQTDDAFRVEWYTQFIQENLSDLAAVAQPMP